MKNIILIIFLLPVLLFAQESKFKNVQIDSLKSKPPHEHLNVNDTTIFGTRTLTGKQILNIDGALKVGASGKGTPGTIQYKSGHFYAHEAADSVLLGEGAAGESVWEETGDTAIYETKVRIGDTLFVKEAVLLWDGDSWEPLTGGAGESVWTEVGTTATYSGDARVDSSLILGDKKGIPEAGALKNDKVLRSSEFFDGE
jgi:hypothetical protein